MYSISSHVCLDLYTAVKENLHILSIFIQLTELAAMLVFMSNCYNVSKSYPRKLIKLKNILSKMPFKSQKL